MPPELVPVPSEFPTTAGELLALLESMSTNVSRCYAGCACSKEANRVVGGFQIRQNEIEVALLSDAGQTELNVVSPDIPLPAEVTELTRIHVDL